MLFRSHARLAAAAFAVLLVGGLSLQAQAQLGTLPANNTFVGHWVWNVAASSQPGQQQGQPSEPRSLTLEIVAADPGRVEWSMTEMDPKGGAHIQSFTGTGDGRPGPVKGNEMNATAAFTIKGPVMTVAFTTPDGGSDHLSCSLSPNGRQMTCRGTESDNRGNREDYVDVYDRR